MNRHPALRRVGATAAPLLALALMAPSLASAQATRTWVSGVGDDANPCSRTAPCKTFAGAISKTAARGEIDVLDPGGFGAVTITKSITIDGGNFAGGILAAGTNGVIVNAGVNDRVTLKNVGIQGVGSGINGVRVLQAGLVRLTNVDISGFSQNGVLVTQSTAGSRRVEIRRSSITNNYGTAPDGVGVQVAPTGGPTVTSKVTISDTAIDDNGRGLVADATNARAKVTVRNSTIEDNGLGGGTGQGVQAIGPEATIRFSGNLITGNLIGLESVLGGGLVSFGNNVYTANDGGGNFTTTTPLS